MQDYKITITDPTGSTDHFDAREGTQKKRVHVRVWTETVNDPHHPQAGRGVRREIFKDKRVNQYVEKIATTDDGTVVHHCDEPLDDHSYSKMPMPPDLVGALTNGSSVREVAVDPY